MTLPTTTTSLSTTWRADFENWLGETRSHKTVSSYMEDLAHFCTWFERINATPFTPNIMNSLDARQYRTWCLEHEKCAPATWNRRRAALSTLVGWAESELGLTLFAFKKVVAAKEVQDEAPHWLTQAEERDILRQAEIDVVAARTPLQRSRALRDRALVAVMRYAGLRVAEAAALELVDVTLSPRSGSALVRSGKRDKQRTVPLSLAVRDALAEWILVRGEGPGQLFITIDGGSLTERAIQKRIEELGGSCHVAVTCHMLRHTCAKRMVEAGVTLEKVRRILGHEKLETTLRYITPGEADLQSAVELGELGALGKE